MTRITSSADSSTDVTTGAAGVDDISEVARMAIALVARGEVFCGPVREIGRFLGRDLAIVHPADAPGLKAAISGFSEACRKVGFVRCDTVGSSEVGGCHLRFDGCEEALGYRVAVVGRAVCSFDEGLMESYLNHQLRRSDIRVREVACLGKGDDACQFLIEGESSAAP